MLRDLPPRARRYIFSVIAVGALTFCLLILRASLTPVLPLLCLVLLSSLTSAFKVQLPIASGSNMSVSYVVDIAALLLRGPHTTMIVAAASGWSQTTLKSPTPNPVYRTLFNMSVLVITVQAAGQVYLALGGGPDVHIAAMVVPLAGMALTYFFANTVPIAVAVALTTNQSAWRVWKGDFVSSAPSYFIGATAAAVMIQVTESSGYWLTLLLTAAPLYLTYKIYRAGAQIEARQGAILEAAHDAILTIDSQLNIREFNPAAERMFGYARLDILGRNVEMLLAASDRTELVSALTRCLAGDAGPLQGHQVELHGLRADGSEFPLELSVARVARDIQVALAAFVRDTTERRALEEQLRQSQKLEAIGRLAGGVAHDFNNILMSIMGAADLLEFLMTEVPGTDNQAPDASRASLAKTEASEIKRAVNRGAAVTRQLLTFSRRQATRPELFALDDAVRGTETMLRRLIGPEIDFEIVSGTAPVYVRADVGQVEQVVLNLVINARDAMPSGGRLVVKIDQVDVRETAAVAFADGPPGPYARLSVADTGIGMDEQTRAKIFEPFFTTKEQGKGTGLGLSIVYGIVKQSGGFITLTSEPGRGTTFLIYLPATLVPEPAAAMVAR